jgi:alkanesulfonate monooxygenase SsuD/methylene tetrahydromethanopterin reductase-like flavin-dependent oxidoreductase (luciferase family)
VVFSRHREYGEALDYARDLRGRLANYGRQPDDVRILPGASVVVGDTPEEAEEKERWMRSEQVNGPRAIAYLEQYWGTDLSGYDPDARCRTSSPARTNSTHPAARSRSSGAAASSS